MPFATEPRERVHGTWPMCRVVVATRRLAPEREYAVFRALQFAQFTTTLVPRGPAGPAARRSPGCPGIDADAIIAAASDPETEPLFEQDSDEARTAAGSPTEFQDKYANTDGRVRYTAPSLKLQQRQPTLEAGGFQTLRGLRRADRQPRPQPHPPRARRGRRRGPAAFPDGLTTAEVAQIMAEDKFTADLDKAEDALITAIGDGAARLPFGHDALWVPEPPRRARRGRLEHRRRRGPRPAPAPPTPTGSSSTA